MFYSKVNIYFFLIPAWVAGEFCLNTQMVHSNSMTDSLRYDAFKQSVLKHRDSINLIFKEHRNHTKLLDSTGKLLTTIYYHQLIPKWIGTRWEFYGETQYPRDSSIACGHFVVTTLKHLGFKVENAHEMATNFSAYMVNSLCDSVYKTTRPEDLLSIVSSKPDDVWVVGLRNHSGLLIKHKGIVHFVHSSYSNQVGVVDELAEESMTFMNSNIYVAGNLFLNNCLTEKWISGEEVHYVKFW